MRRIALVNQKGGVGKTTTAVNLAAALDRLGKRVLLVDLDPQANTTVHVGLQPHELTGTLYDVLSGRKTAREVIVRSPAGLDILPSNIELAGAEVELVGAIGREAVLKDALEEVTDYDFILVDCPPSLGILNVNGLNYVDEIFIPVQCEFFALQGISLLMRTIDRVRKRLNPKLAITGVIPCMYDARKGLSKEVLAEIEKHFASTLFQAKIRANVRLAEAPSFGQTIFQYAEDSNGAQDYLALAKEVAGNTETKAEDSEPPAREPERAITEPQVVESSTKMVASESPQTAQPCPVNGVKTSPAIAESEPAVIAALNPPTMIPAQPLVPPKLPTFAEAMRLAAEEVSRARAILGSATVIDATRPGLDPSLIKEVAGTKPDLGTHYPEGTIEKLAETLNNSEDAA